MIAHAPLSFHPLALVMMLLSMLAACTQSDAEPRPDTRKGPPAARVEVTVVRTGPLDRSWSAVGSLKANESVIVRPDIAGRIARIGFEEGQRVTMGTPLFELDDSVFLAQIA
ncbi:MAG: biotin/lipoyl-binding protein, partial [Panacagrimonas sp.]